ncbi:MAG TPA: TRAP transporter small permease, partial [Xanthobacteraceae bacterium]|nr:TRAP transporter small permease [Xanthobacteraceae bacterium]
MATEVHKPITGDELAHTFEEAAPEADLSVYAVEDWFTLALFWFMALA